MEHDSRHGEAADVVLGAGVERRQRVGDTDSKTTAAASDGMQR